MIWRCATCGVETDFSAQRQHEQWHIDLDLRLDLMASVIEALVKNQKRDPAPTTLRAVPPATGSAVGP